VRFEPEGIHREAVAACCKSHRARIELVLEDVEIEHIGSTAVPGALTKGDLDLLVSVPEPRFSSAIDSLKDLYVVDQPENWSSTFASFRHEPEGDIPVGVQVVIAGSGDESLFLEWRDRLRSDAGLLERFNAFKRDQEGTDPDSYVEAKALFIESVLGRTPNAD
jgi:GrpB-like predicted nucleotidyltransferase (UPF0157 family)